MPSQTFPLRPPDVTATGTLSAAQATLASATAPTSSVALALAGGQGSVGFALTGTITTSTITVDGSHDPNPATINWVALPFSQVGQTTQVTTYTLASANADFEGSCAAFAQLRVRLVTRAGTDSISVTLRSSAASSTSIKATLAPGTNAVGSVSLSAGAPSLTRVTPSSPTTTASSDNTIGFGALMQNYFVQNNTAATVYVNEDAAATQGSKAVAAGSYILRDVQVTNLHIYTPAAISVNGTTAGGLVVEGLH